jgi:plasmid stabilization system protein ParE
MKLRIKFDPDARAEADESFHWYEARQQGAGQTFFEALNETLARVADLPMTFPIVDEPVRRAPVHHFPFGVYFTMEDGYIFVVAVFHAKRDPQVWKDRI